MGEGVRGRLVRRVDGREAGGGVSPTAYNQAMTHRARRYTLTLRVSADDWADIAECVQRLARHLLRCGPECDMAGMSLQQAYLVHVVDRGPG